MVVIVNSFKGNNMVRLRSAFIRLFEQNKLIGFTGLLLGLFRKDFVNNTWLFQVLICPLPGKDPSDFVQRLRIILDKYKMPF